MSKHRHSDYLLPELIPSLFFIGCLSATLVSYWPGLSGSFLFDDFGNLPSLGAYGDINNFQALYIYLTTGTSGPTGRPISLLSFLINDNSWPSNPWGFKYTNLLLHLLNACLLFWLLFRYLLLLLPNKSYITLAWVAALSAGFWLLHPFFVSTTLYVVQRMTQLAALFVILSILTYIYGRSLLTIRPVTAYIWMSLSTGFGTFLAMYSKENGALLPLLILVIEHSLLFNPDLKKLNKWWKAMFLLLPSLLIAAYLIGYTVSSDTVPYPRTFSHSERVLTETRILLDYLHNLLIPQMQTTGLFNETYTLSRSIVEPPATLISICVILAFISTALTVNKRFPLLSISILFFFAGHILESTVIPLELYFEHRNYLPSMFLFLPLSTWLVKGYLYSTKSVYILISCTIVIIFTLFTWQRANLWGDSNKLILNWAQENPSSPRAQSSAAIRLSSLGYPALGLRILEQALKLNQDSIPLYLHYLLFKSTQQGVSKIELQQIIAAIASIPHDFRSLNLLEEIIHASVSKQTIGFQPNDVHALINALTPMDSLKDSPKPIRQRAHLHGLLFASQNQPEAALMSFKKAFNIFKDVDTGLLHVATLANRGFLTEALELLHLLKEPLNQQDLVILRKPAEWYIEEINRLTSLLYSERDKKPR